MIRFVAIVPEQGSAYFLEPNGALIQVPLLIGGLVEVPEPGRFKDGDEAEVEWFRAFESDAEAETVRVVERALAAIPDDLTDAIAPHRFNLTIKLGDAEMRTPADVVNALRQAAEAIEAGAELAGNVYTASGNAQVGSYSGSLPPAGG